MITPEFYPEINGVSRAYFEWLQHFLNAGVEVLFICPDYSAHPIYARQAAPEMDLLQASPNFRCHRFPIRPLARGGSFYSAPQRKTRWNLDRALDEFQPDVVTCDGVERFAGLTFGWDGYGAPAGVSYARKRQVPAIALFQTDYYSAARAHASLAERAAIPLAARYWRRILNSYDEVLVHSPSYVKFLRDSLKVRRVQQVPFIGIDSRRIAPQARERVSGEREAAELLFVGRISADKRVEFIIRVARLLHSRGGKLRLSLVGSGPDEAALKRRFGDAPWIRFHGWKTGDDLWERYRSADIFINASTSETFGLATIEAMSCGLPVIGADSGHTPYLLDDEVNGLLFEPGNLEDLCVKIQRLASDGDMRTKLGQAAIAKAQSLPTWAHAGAALLTHLSTSRTQGSRAGTPVS
jgi:glycosyltransferase involved in cell wall biosynthesis